MTNTTTNTTNTALAEPDVCLHCGQGEHRHQLITGSLRICPMTAFAFRSKQSYDAAIRATDQQALAERDAEIARLQETLERIETFGTNWATGVEENLERVREIARLALGGNDAE